MSEPIEALSDSNLLTSTERVVTTMRRVDLALLEHLAAIEVRELHLKSGYSSLFKMCTDKFRLSEASAYRRVAASRLIHQYPAVKAQLLAGEVNMCTLATVAARLKDLPEEDERQALLSAIAGKSKSQVEEWLAQRNSGGPAKKRDIIRPMGVAQKPLALACDRFMPHKMDSTRDSSQPLSPAQTQTTASSPVSFRIAFTASSTFRDKLQKAQDLLRHKLPDGNLESVLEEALDHLIKSRDLVQKRIRKESRTATNPRYIPTKIKRLVIVRDGGQCTFTADGHRCKERSGLEFEHRVPFARGGSSVDPGNIELLCRNHNAWRARQEFAKARRLSGRTARS